ncbi:peptide chain release factor N(5)-glutamine methyltransferase [Elioraea rosea]|uniref:peptide chain release factor N(5)-glutamine methyltransferase n=1 Tax=Elioraea rosea TaxID=2492390 RepID=UPI00118377D6|nr:peptide chain release factor N(5)-glutamine methyltransferase [Elioraea rosea]
MNGTETIGALLCEAGAAFRAAGIEEARVEARLLLGHVLGRKPLALPLEAHRAVSAADAARFRALVARRAAREPSAHLTGTRGFWTLDLAVTPDVLIPRPDTETIVACALDHVRDRCAVHRVLDLGTGSGAILLALLSELPRAYGVGLDRSAAALAVARRNAEACGVAARAGFVRGNWARAIAGGFDIVVSNPPYIDQATIATLEPEVARHEPRGALDGGEDGLDAYRAILPDLRRLLAPGGIAVLELGFGQAESVAALAREAGLVGVELRQDLGGVPRAFALRPA